MTNPDLAKGTAMLDGASIVHFSRAAGFAGLVCATTYLAGFALLMTVLAPLGYGSNDIDANAVVSFIQENALVMIAWNSVIYILNALALIVLVVGIAVVLIRKAPVLALVSPGLGLVWACLVLGGGMTANMAVEQALLLYPVSPEQAAQTWRLLHAVELGLGGGNEIAGGAWLLCVSLGVLGAGVLPRMIALTGLCAGTAGVVTLYPAAGDIAGSVFGLVTLVWFAAVGIVLVRAEGGLKQ